MKQLKIFAILGLVLFFLGCLGLDSTDTGVSDDQQDSVSDSAVSTTANQMISFVSSTLGSNSSGIANTYLKSVLGVGRCSDTDSDVTVTKVCSDDANTATILRDFGDGCDLITSTVITGKQKIYWDNIGSSACSTLAVRPRFWYAVQGTGTANTRRLVSTDENYPADPSDDTSPVSSITRTFSNGATTLVTGYVLATYSGYANDGTTESVTETVVIPGTRRIRYRSDGTTIVFDVTIATATDHPLVIELSRTGVLDPAREIQSGQINVTHNRAHFTTSHTFSGVIYDYRECPCFPTEGTITITVTSDTDGSTLGTGSITFSHTSGDDDSCGSAEMTYDGQVISFATLAKCY